MAKFYVYLLLSFAATYHTLALALHNGAGVLELARTRRAVSAFRYQLRTVDQNLRGGCKDETDPSAETEASNATVEVSSKVLNDGDTAPSSDDLDDVASNKRVYEAAFGFRATSRVGAAAYNLAISVAMTIFVSIARSRAMSRAEGLANPFVTNLMTYAMYVAVLLQVPPFLFLVATSLPELSSSMRYSSLSRKVLAVSLWGNPLVRSAAATLKGDLFGRGGAPMTEADKVALLERRRIVLRVMRSVSIVSVLFLMQVCYEFAAALTRLQLQCWHLCTRHCHSVFGGVVTRRRGRSGGGQRRRSRPKRLPTTAQMRWRLRRRRAVRYARGGRCVAMHAPPCPARGLLPDRPAL